MKVNNIIAAALLSLVLALGLVARTHSLHQGFRKEVTESLATSEGYDQKFIELVNHLEDALTTRASFPYPGGKDPMTGRRREVATEVLAAAPAPRKPAASRPPVAKPGKPVPGSAPTPPESPVDRVRLTAIIADDYGQHTAIVMDGERSLSVDVGDTVRDRKVTRITSKDLAMEDANTVYLYSLSGARIQQRK